MAPVDEQIAKARLERKKSMEQPGVAQVAEKMAYDQAQTGGSIAGCDTQAYRPPTLAEEAEKSATSHFDEYVKAQGVASFLRRHPEFEEFIQLLRSGALQVIVFAICAVAAFAQAPPTPEPQLSTAESTAIQCLEKQKQDAQQSYQQALQAEMTISREFAVAHAGYHLDGQSFAVQKDAAAAAAPAPAPRQKLPVPTPEKK